MFIPVVIPVKYKFEWDAGKAKLNIRKHSVIFDRGDEVTGETLQSEYRFDYKKSKPNRFAGQLDETQVVVMLDSDIARVFRSSEDVNAVLRALIENMPPKRRTRTKASSQSDIEMSG